jgi:hypothetical protein
LTAAALEGRIAAMSGVDVVVETSAPPEKVREALLDFSQRRPERWPGITPELYEVYEVGERSAEIKEGTRTPVGAFWARERYEWDDGDTIRWTAVGSNFWKPGSSVSATLKPGDEGGTRLAIHWDRRASTIQGKIGAFIVRRTRGKPVAAAFRQGLEKLEA